MADRRGEDAKWAFAQLSVQYYVAGRMAAYGRLIPTLGNLFHHAIELALKAALAKSLSLPDLKRLGHNLPGLWRKFEATAIPGGSQRFAPVIEELHKFEELRYPDSVLARGAMMELAIYRNEGNFNNRTASPEPCYTLVLEDVDELHAFIFDAASINPRALRGPMSAAAKEFMFRDNRHAGKWQ